MKDNKKIVSVLSLLIALAFTSQVMALTGKEIMQKNSNLPEPTSAKIEMMMEIHKDNEVTKKEFSSISMKFKNGDEKALITFVKPRPLKVLTHSYKNREDDQWIRLSSGKVKRITGSGKGESFANSHISYEDIQKRKLENFDYKLLESVKVGNDKCYKIEAVDIKGSTTYEKLIYYVRESDYSIMKVDFYMNGKLLKYLENFDIKKVKGILTPYKLVVTQGEEKTVLQIKSVEYNIELQESKFSKDALSST